MKTGRDIPLDYFVGFDDDPALRDFDKSDKTYILGSLNSQYSLPKNPSLSFDEKSGLVKYFSIKSNKSNSYPFKRGTDGYTLIKFLANNSPKFFKHTILADELESERIVKVKDGYNPERRVRSAVTYIKKKLNIKSRNELIICNNKQFALESGVKIIE